MATLKPPNGTKMTKQHYEWLAWSIRQVALKINGYESGILEDGPQMTELAEYWADECGGTNPAFNRDRFISAVVNGEW